MTSAARTRRRRRRDESRPGDAPARRQRDANALPALVAGVLAEPGEPLDALTRGEMERRLGHNFAAIRIHADVRAGAAARAVQADAFTSGADIVFGPGRYRPDAGDGRRLLAHELVHALQQGSGAPAPSLQVAAPVLGTPDPLEAEAAAVADRVAAGGAIAPGDVSVAAPAARGRIARQAAAALANAPLEVPDSPAAVGELTDEVARFLRFDPDDSFGRARRRLARLAPTTREAVAGGVRGRVPDQAADRLAAILAELRPPGARPADTELREDTTPDGAPPESAARETATAGEQRPDEAAPEAEPEAEAEAAAPEGTAPSAPGTESPERASTPAEPVEADVPEPEPEVAAPVAVPQLDPEATEAAADEPAAEAKPEAAEPHRATEAATGPPAPATTPGAEAEQPGPDEDAADLTAAEDTEAEALEAHDEADDADADEPAAGAPPSAGGASALSGAEPSGAEQDLPGAGSGGADATTAEEPGPSGSGQAEAASEPAASESGEAEAAAEPAASESDDTEVPAEQEPDLAEAAEAEPEADEELVAEMPADEAAADEEPAGDADALEPEAAEEPTPGSELEAEPEDSSDPDPSGEAEPAAGEEPRGGADGDAVPIEEPAEPEVPDLSNADPAEAVAAVGGLPPAQAEAALAGVDAAAARSVAAKRAALAEQPPELDRPTGAPTTAELEAESAAEEEPLEAADRLAPAPAAPPLPPSRPAPLPPAPAPVTAQARAPQVHGGAEGELSADDQKAVRASIGTLPVHDPGLELPRPAPGVLELEGAADPERAHTERDKVEDAARTALGAGRRQLLRPAGENRLVPRLAPEKLRAAIALTASASPATPATSAPAAGARGGTTSDSGPAASIIAQEQRGAELRAASAAASADMRAKGAKHAATAAQERQRSQEQVTELVQQSAQSQATRRSAARAEVHDQRQRWSAAEHEHSEGSLTRADRRLETTVEQVGKVKTDADEKARTHVEKGERDAGLAKREGESKAAAARKRGEEETSGPIGWLAKQAKAFFDEIKAAISDAFEAARAAVRDAIEGAKRLATQAIDFARDTVVSAIRVAGDALIAIGDTMLAGFPGLRDRFRGAIESRMARAQAAVEELAEDLKTGVQKALDLLGAALDAALGLLEKGLLLAVDAVRATVNDALRFANSVIKGFVAFAVLIKHIAANPRQWIRNLVISAKEGVRNHLWKAFKAAIKRWFSEKVEEVLGLGLTIWNLLKKGGISLARIGTMAWEGIKAAIPPTLIQLLIEKLISLLVPAAAAVMLIIEGLQAAWGAVQRVLEAFERFFVFLKAVRTGKAGPQFANAIAAAAIAVIDFVANWLLKRLRKPAGKIAKKLKALAKKLGKKLAKLGKGLFKKKRRKKPKLKGKPKKKPAPDKRAKAQRRVDAASTFIERQLARGMPSVVLFAQLLYARGRWRVRVHWRERDDVATLDVEANPRKRSRAGQKPAKDDYVSRVEGFQGFVRKYHHRHHILTRALSPWWNAVKLDWNDPKRFLDVPAMLHLRGLHSAWTGLNPTRAAGRSKVFKKRLYDAWNVTWVEWLTGRLTTWRITVPTLTGFKAAVRADAKLSKRVAHDIDGPGTRHVLRSLGALTGVSLAKFRVHEESEARHARYLKQLAKLNAKLKGVRSPSKRKKIIARWQKGLAGKITRAKVVWWLRK